MNLVKPGGLFLPPSLQLKEVKTAGGFTVGELVPWKGVFFGVLSIQANDDTFRLVMAPIGPTKGAIKKRTGKKGARNEQASPRANGRHVTYGRVSSKRRKPAANLKEAA